MNRNSKRGLILAAASSVVKHNGIEKLTLEAVAAEAGVSKGGLLHHFPNKEALIQSMVSGITNDFVTDVQTRVDSDSQEKGKWSRAYLESTAEGNQEGLGMNVALNAALFSNKDLLEELREHYAFWQRNIENDGVDPVLSSIVRLAADGLWLSEVFGIGEIGEDMRGKVISKLQDMLK
ncbi:TetR/AcrR family transcriptional regulator [Paenibacillus sp. MMS20-IR301]|uniref:TetR/AcrR family transcriptional regulator n=1 Tax=Paenibacillus sp. MMS20-IR301 TaxID=2895946 RepID=UPI0028E410FE|nr:TetR/AcrR family transcriptional regulator [Paenibacillus sp. MMS20-IR301]WNS44666.1 TetR/AcrR family transcriptional regulator [Paenibacillus sp. MMS20-IR301]